MVKAKRKQAKALSKAAKKARVTPKSKASKKEPEKEKNNLKKENVPSLEEFLDGWENENDDSGDSTQSLVDDDEVQDDLTSFMEKLKDNDDVEDEKDTSDESNESVADDDETPDDLDSLLEENGVQNGVHDSDDEKSDDEEDSDSEDSGDDKNVEYITKLSQKDPEFYDFLKENDKDLLNFDDDDDSDDNEEDEVHKPPAELEMASDESDFEDDAVDEDGQKKPKKAFKGKYQKITKKMIADWEKSLDEKASVSVLTEVIEALRSAIRSLDSKSETKESKYIVEGGAMFNSIVRMCLAKVQPALNKILKIDKEVKPSKLSSNKKWKSVEKIIKDYTMSLISLLGAMNEESVVCVLLKHCHQMVSFFSILPKPTKQLLQKLISFWSTGEESVRMVAFLCIIKLTRILQSTHLEYVIKQMYIAYVKNCRFTSPNTWPVINFMRRSLSEIFALDLKVSYNHAFVYIRQLSISLRNAITVQEKETISAIYNWQFIHSIHLWAHLLGACNKTEAMEGLIFPLVQLIDGVIRLVYTLKFYPLRFHLCQILTKLSSETGAFIPVLPYYLDILHSHNFNKKTSKVSMKPIDFSCILRISKSQMLENGTKDSILDGVYRGMMEYLSTQAGKISYPELVIPCVMQTKEFLSKCKVANYCKKLKQLVDKVEENKKFILNKRKNANFSVGDKEKIRIWELEIDGKSPLYKFYQEWNKVKIAEQEKIQRDTIDDYDFIPQLKKKDKKKVVDEDDDDEDMANIFEDDEDEEDDIERFKLKEDRNKEKTDDSEEEDEEEEEENSEEEEMEQEEDDEDDDALDEVVELKEDDFNSDEEDDEEEDDDDDDGEEEEEDDDDDDDDEEEEEDSD